MRRREENIVEESQGQESERAEKNRLSRRRALRRFALSGVLTVAATRAACSVTYHEYGSPDAAVKKDGAGWDKKTYTNYTITYYH